MMNRPWLRWLLFGLCLAVFTAAMLWITQRALHLEEQRAEAGEQARRQEKVRLALWRMEAVASAVVVRESARPAHHYQPFHTPEEWAVGSPGQQAQPNIPRLPSPLLGTLPDFVKLHFERVTSPQPGIMCSPQSPLGEERELALANFSLGIDTATAANRLEELRLLLEAHPGWKTAPGLVLANAAQKPFVPQKPFAALKPGADFEEQLWRNNTLLQNNIQQQAQLSSVPAKKVAIQPAAPAALADESGPMQALWMGGELLLMRRAVLGGVPRVQGAWLDWPALEKRLLAAAADLLPQAKLEPVEAVAAEEDWKTLVTLPARLIPGPLPVAAAAAASGLRPALLAAWACLIVAALATAVVLQRAVQLSERRAAFVSAVTHELRTPLTTFGLYSEMLAEGMVTEEGQRQAYLKTLCEESKRLMHLVENVLSFSRIERGRAAVRLESAVVADLLARFQHRLQTRCEQAGLEWCCSIEESSQGARVMVDAMAVEQILFNLVDNACKYAGPDSQPAELHLDVRCDDARVMFIVRDYGPGLPPEQKRRLFQPFSKSASEAAHSAPGVGLGLALSRRLARELGGDLQSLSVNARGAAFSLRLPVAAPEA